MNLPKVELEGWCPGAGKPPVKIPAAICNAIMPYRENKDESIMMPIPVVQKLWLTEASELAIFGNIVSYRNANLPPLLGGDYAKKLAYIEEDQVIIYNEKTKRSYRDDPEKAEKHLIKPGVVSVYRADWSIKLQNVPDIKTVGDLKEMFKWHDDDDKVYFAIGDNVKSKKIKVSDQGRGYKGAFIYFEELND